MRIVISNLVGGAIGAILLIASVQAAPTENAQGVVTAQDRKSDEHDLDLTAAIRRAVLDDRALSISAHNVKIIAKDGFVTLRGAVRTSAERATISAKAKEIAGAERVKDALSVPR